MQFNDSCNNWIYLYIFDSYCYNWCQPGCLGQIYDQVPLEYLSLNSVKRYTARSGQIFLAYAELSLYISLT